MNERKCENCVHYYKRYCTLELNNLDYSLLSEGMYRNPEETCNCFEGYEEDEE